MTRFREEHYDTRSHRAWSRLQRSDNESHQGSEGPWALTWSETWWPLRSQSAAAAEADATTKPEAEEVGRDDASTRKVVAARLLV